MAPAPPPTPDVPAANTVDLAGTVGSVAAGEEEQPPPGGRAAGAADGAAEGADDMLAVPSDRAGKARLGRMKKLLLLAEKRLALAQGELAQRDARIKELEGKEPEARPL